MRRLTTGSPEFRRRISGSAPRLPTRMTLLTLPAMTLSCARPNTKYTRRHDIRTLPLMRHSSAPRGGSSTNNMEKLFFICSVHEPPTQCNGVRMHRMEQAKPRNRKRLAGLERHLVFCRTGTPDVISDASRGSPDDPTVSQIFWSYRQERGTRS